MRKFILAATIIGFSMGGAFAQPSQPQNATGPTSDQAPAQNGMKKQGMTGTSGMSQDSMSKDGMKKNGMMDKSKENKPVDGMKK